MDRTQGIGRGGRGALILAALRSQGRRPDREDFGKQENIVQAQAASQTISNNRSTETLPNRGRGIYLQSPLQKIGGTSFQIPGRGACAFPTTTLASQNENDISQRESVSPFKEKEGICNIPFGRGCSPIQNISEPKVTVPNVGRGRSCLLLEASATQSNTTASKGVNVSPSSKSGALSPSSKSGVLSPSSKSGALSSSSKSGALSSSSKSGALSSSSKSGALSPSSESGSLSPSSEFGALSIKRHSGTSGKPINLEVNYVRLNTKKGAGVYEYHVSFEPIVDSRNMRFKLLNQQNVKNLIGDIKTFDGSKLYLPVRLSMSNVKVVTSMPTDESSVNVFFKFVSVCQAKDCLHLYNVLFRKIMHILKMTPVGRNYFDPRSGITVPQHKLEIWPGYITAVQEYEGGVMLNCDASFRVLRTVTVRDVICELSLTRGEMKDAVAKAILGNIVLTRYNNKTYRIDDIDWNLSPKSSFATKNGKSITFKDYYKQSYDIDIKDDGQPLLISRPKKRPGETSSDKLLCLIPELSYMTGLTDTMRSDFRVMKDISVHTRVTPNTRQHALRKFIENVNSCPKAKQTLLDWNLEIDSAVVSLDGRLLPIEEISMAKNGFLAGNEANWSRNISKDHVIVPVHLVNWVVVCTRHETGKVNEFVSMMNKVCPSMGITVRNPRMSVIANDRTESYRNAIKEVVNPTVQIVVVIFPTPRDDRYNAVKKLCCVEMPVPSQVINVKTISDYSKLRSVTQKIALQMNCKLGGELWSLRIPLSNVMICGLDSYHDVSNKKQSVLGFVASINSAVTRWFSMTTFQNIGQELGDSLKILLIASLKKYYDVNHRLPDKIIIYRDGVGDGLLDIVAQYEAEQFKSCFKHFGNDYSPSLSVIVVQKRINTRMYLGLGANKDDITNPPPGSVLDHTVTRKKWYDFFLVSQHVRQGTVSPTHYVIVHDSSTLKPDHMQRLAYKMTHLYYNWPGTVRVPAPCQYAHKLAYLVGENLHKQPHFDLSDKLFYL